MSLFFQFDYMFLDNDLWKDGRLFLAFYIKVTRSLRKIKIFNHKSKYKVSSAILIYTDQIY